MGRLATVLALCLLVATPALAKHEAKGESGIASIYAKQLGGQRTASGQLLDIKGMTAAHRNLPFGTRLLVTNKANGRQVVVTVNDRGPHRKGRIIDLSPAAASKLGMTHAGLARVDLKIAAR